MKRRMRRLSVLVTPQTFWHLARIAKMAGFGDNLGRVIDKLVREKALQTQTVENKFSTEDIRAACTPCGRTLARIAVFFPPYMPPEKM